MLSKLKFLLLVLVSIAVIAATYAAYSLRNEKSRTKLFTKLLKIEMYMLEKCPITHQDGNVELSSQYYEDYILSYVFDGQKNGFYIDVGASDPNSGNVTKYFHSKGWRGMNFEPQTVLYNAIVASRPNDININKAVTNSIGKSTFYIPKSMTGWSTLEQDIIIKSKMDHEEITVDTTTLNNEIEQHNLTNIDILKIDVESYEDVVLSGIDLHKYRPKVIVAEAHSLVDFYGNLKFEPILVKNNYKLGMYDGLNYYYYREESPEFAEKFRKIHRCVSISQLIRNTFCQNEDHCSY